MGRGAFILSVSFAWSSVAFAQQQVGVELRVEAKALEEGESVDAQLVFTNTGEPESPQMVAPDGLELRLLSSTPSRSSMVSIVNGRRTDTTTHVYPLRLTARKAGQYTLGPFQVAAGGSTFESNAVSITVRRPSADQQRDGDRLVFARIGVQRTSLYVTQSFEATLTFAIRKVESEGRAMDIGNLLQFVDGGASDLSVFGTRFTPSEATLVDSNGARHTYVVYRQTRDIRAEQVGAMQIGPVFLKVNYPVSLRRSWLGGLEAAETRREIARADAVVVEVKGPPLEGRPADFTGAIGVYSISAIAKPTRVEQGQPVTLTIVVKGEPLDGLAGPDIGRFPDLVSRFDFARDELTGETEGQARVFRRAIFPRQVGEQTIPPITWSYFDPSAERYVSLATAAIPIVVDPSTSSSAVEDGVRGSPRGASRTLTVLSGGISPNHVEPRLVLANQSWSMSPAASVALLASPPVLCLLVTMLARRRDRVRSDPTFGRRHGAGRRARRRIAVALRSADSARQWDELAEAVTGFVADRFGLPPGELTPGEVRSLLRDRASLGEIADEVAAFLEIRDAVRFAPGATDGMSAVATAARAREWIARMEQSPC